jgi:hypothetical protein
MRYLRMGTRLQLHTVAALLAVGCALTPAGATAQPGYGPRASVDQSFTTTRPGTPTGIRFSGVYHATGDPNGNPPYLHRMVLYPPPGMRFDNSVPDQCTASDVQLEVMGPAACPPGSRLGGGTTEGLFFEPIAHSFVLDHYTHDLEVFNTSDGQILLIQSEGFTVVHGRNLPDGSTEYDPPTCFPAPPVGQCLDDYVLQLKSSNFIPPYTKTAGGVLRGYATTPSSCPAVGYWQTTIKFSWADGAVESVASREPCDRPPLAGPAAASRHPQHLRRHRRSKKAGHGHRHRARALAGAPAAQRPHRTT